MHNVTVSVRHLVEFILRSGNIDTGYFISKDRALEGTRVHQRIQRIRKDEAEQAGGEYKSEVRFRSKINVKDISFSLEGRADGLYIINEAVYAVYIEEIKSTLLPLEQLTSDSNPLYWAQAKCYAYIYARDNGLDEIFISLIYGHVETENQVTFTEKYQLSDLTIFVHDLLNRYYDFAKLDMICTDEARTTGTALSFPYKNYRTGQRELAVAMYIAIKNKKKLFAQAPTGIGKTIAALFSAVKATAEGLGTKIFYATSKEVQRHLAEDALQLMSYKGLILRSLTITAKDKICFQEKRACNPIDCSYAKGHFDRINQAILDCIGNEQTITRKIVEKYAFKHKVCPSELALDISFFCMVIICDYNHIYDPKAQLKRFFRDGGDFILLQDEAHNLVDRAREMFSAEVRQKDFISLRRNLGRIHKLYKSANNVAKAIPGDPADALQQFASDCELWFKENPSDQSENLLSSYFNALDYLKTKELYDERYTTYREDNSIRLFCIDPSYLLSKEQKKSRTSIFFSATLTPLLYFKEILGGEESDFIIRLGSPFPRANLCVVVESRISILYKHREHSLKPVAECIYDMVKAKTGNYMVFFPSYAYLNQVFEIFTYNDIDIVRQIQLSYESSINQTNVENVEILSKDAEPVYLSHFENTKRTKSLLGFAVLGGAYSEGIDLAGDSLIGAAIVGVGMPQLSAERDIIADYYNSIGKGGFNIAYVYPGMNKVLQAAGRVIRTETDKGIVLLIDSRYTEYSKLFPNEWYPYVRLNDEHKNIFSEFWRN